MIIKLKNCGNGLLTYLKGQKLNRIVTIQDEDKGTIKAKTNGIILYMHIKGGLDCRRCPDEIVISNLPDDQFGIAPIAKREHDTV